MSDEKTVEEVAQEMGWADKDGWQGDPDQWKPAVDFIRDTQSISQDKGSEIVSLKKQLDGLTGEMRNMGINQARQIKEATDTARARLLSERSQAVEEGDTEKFGQVERQLQQINSHPSDPTIERRAAEFQQGMVDFAQRNPWYATDKSMAAFANMYGESLAKANPNIAQEEYYASIEDVVRSQFAHKVANDKRVAPAAVSPDKPASNRSSSWSELKSVYPEAEATFNDLVKRKIFTNDDRESYAKQVLAT